MDQPVTSYYRQYYVANREKIREYKRLYYLHHKKHFAKINETFRKRYKMLKENSKVYYKPDIIEDDDSFVIYFANS